MKNYKKDHDHLLRLMKELEIELPETMAGFDKMQRSHSMDGALPAKTKELVALGISIVAKCEGCMTIHVQHALNAGATRTEIMEVVSVAIMMGGGPAVVYACQVLEALDEFRVSKQPASLYDSN